MTAQLDKYDKKIVALLVSDARLSVSDIGRNINLSRSAVADRIRRLESTGVITGYHAHIQLELEHKVSAYFAMTFSPLICDALQPYIASIPEIRLAHSISGDVDLILLVEAASMSRLSEIRVAFDSWPNIQRVVTHTVLTTRIER